MNRAEVRAKVRRENFAKLKAHYKTNAALAEKLGAGFSPSYVSQLLSGHRSIGDDVADKIEERLACQAGFLDQLEESQSDEIRARKVWVCDTEGNPIPGASRQYAEETSEDPRAFIVRWIDNSAAPRFMHGEYVLVEPSVTPELEDDVLVQLSVGGQIFIKRLLSRRGGVRLGSYSTPEVMTFDEHEIAWMYFVANRIPSHKIKTQADPA